MNQLEHLIIAYIIRSTLWNAFIKEHLIFPAEQEYWQEKINKWFWGN